jgi:hypothetical protein
MMNDNKGKPGLLKDSSFIVLHSSFSFSPDASSSFLPFSVPLSDFIAGLFWHRSPDNCKMRLW